jgi:hypothetical protein
MSSDSVDGARFNSGEGLSYSNYMQLFFVTKSLFYIGREADAATELAMRAGNLIEWNMINYQNGINADEGKMAEALRSGDRFRLEDMKTDFSITTTVNMRMLFLSMPFARNFSTGRGIGMPSAMAIQATDYRGY